MRRGRMGRKACTGAGLTARRGGRAALAVGGLAVMALLRADGVSAVIVDGHVSGFGPAGRALHGAAALRGHQQRAEGLYEADRTALIKRSERNPSLQSSWRER